MRLRALVPLGVMLCLCAPAAQAQTTFNAAFDAIRARADYAHSFFGVEIYSLDRKAVLYQWNGDKLFVPGSTTKLLTVGTALSLLGPDFRFHTPVYRTGPIRNGTLKGNLVLVGSGDANLSGRTQPDSTLAFTDEDHSYGGFESKLIGDPLAALESLAQQVAASGIRRIDGQVLVDASLFPEGKHEGGTGTVVSSLVVNDNVVDIVMTPGTGIGKPVALQISPLPSYIRIVNKTTTGAAGTKVTLDTSAKERPDKAVEVTLTGTMPLDAHALVNSYAVESPSRFAAALFVQALEQKGVSVKNRAYPATPTGDAFKAYYTSENRVAEFVSAPFREDVKLTLKMSQNLHAELMPFVLGATLGKAKDKIDLAGFGLEHDFLSKAGLDLTSASQGDGPGARALFTPDFMVHYLAFMAATPNFEVFRNALPVLGKDGTLFKIATQSPAAGHVFAKTGTYDQADYVNHSATLTGKGLAGYTTTPSGEHLAFALYVNNVPLKADMDDQVKMSDAVTNVGEMLGDIAAAAYSLPIEPAK
jgi:PBP4 family serine-type D-alanyl-D-alanine carboxypeptidase